jgi:SAM-dependent methyltransferase
MKLVAGSNDYLRGGTQKETYSADEVVEVPCPLCGSEARGRVYTEHGAVGVSRCRDCGLVYTSPRIREPERIYWGSADSYFEEARLIFEGRATHHRDPNYRQEIARIARHKSKGRFLDVGCNMGMLLRLLPKNDWEAVGIEPSPSLAGLAERHGFKVFNCFLHELPKDQDGSFDVVALSDVFEHITDPRSFLATAQRFLKDDGVMFVKVPNVKWSIFKQAILGLLGHRPEQGLWDAYEHVVHYSQDTLTRMFAAAGLRIVEMGFDAPVQTPNWHEHVGHYYQYPTPPLMDWRRKAVRSTAHLLAYGEYLCRLGSIGYLAPNLVAVARRDKGSGPVNAAG